VAAEEVRPLRHEVLRAGQPFSATYYPGDDHPLAAHVAVRSEEFGVVAVGSVCPDPPPWAPDKLHAWRIRGMATQDRFRGRGLGGRVLAALTEHAASNAGELLWCHARVRARDFYRRAGFESIGEVFDDGIAQHQSMQKTLSPVAART
jgi:GNAT superfamily N-acetyltransferase